MRRLIYALALIATFLVAIPKAALCKMEDKPRIGLLLNASKRHQDEFNSALKSLQWEAESFNGKAESLEELKGRLSDLDLLIVGPLFSPEKEAMTEEMKEAYRQFLKKGGLIAVTDGSYPIITEWLAGIDPAFGGLVSGKCNSSQWAVRGVTADLEVPHALRSFPFRITEPNSWPHFEKPDGNSKWMVVSNCSEGFPVTFAQKYGKGMITVSSLRQATDRQLANFYANLILSRADIELRRFDLPEPELGEGTLTMELGSNPKPGASLVYEITPENAQPQRFEAAFVGRSMELKYRFSHRGATTLRLILKHDGREALLFSRQVTLPELLTVEPNAYRGILSTVRRLPDVNFQITLAPDKENLIGAKVGVEVFDAEGKKVSEAARNIASDRSFSYKQPLVLASNLPEGTYKVKARLIQQEQEQEQELAASETTFKIIAPQEAQTIIDEDNTILVNGKPFFPLGLYHVKPEDYESVAALGVNTVQYWTWHQAKGLEAAAQHGLKALFELNHKSEKIIEDTVEKFGDNPTILMWYGVDEPSEGSYSKAEMMVRAFNKADEQRPVFTVSCRPDAFAEQAGFGNIFAVDPYGDPDKVIDWMTKATTAVGGAKPVICVPGSFGEEGLPEFRASAYIALTKDARGIIWYPWSQAGGGPVGIGLKNHPEQQAVLKEVIGEIKALHEALTAPLRVPFVSESKEVHGIYTSAAGQHYIILVNGTSAKVKGEATIPAPQTINGKFSDFFQRKDDSLSVENGRFEITLDPYETRAFVLK